MYNSQLNPQKTSKNTSRYLGYGLLIGTVFGVLVGKYFKYQVIAIVVSIVVSMTILYFLGKKKDKKVNEQLKNLAYAVKTSSYIKERDIYKLVIVDKKGNEKTLPIKKDKYKKLNLTKYELVYLKENGQITPAYSHTKEVKHKSILDIANDYKKIKEEKSKNQNFKDFNQ
ncbi:MAG: hypothetical protein PUG67_09055 [Peptoniphilaceae bacterium]|nr:hypothetical protein [Peptoniphilaceae bacterium]MDY6018530.1 hypothetical protein [Anaerococcus sp.]